MCISAPVLPGKERALLEYLYARVLRLSWFSPADSHFRVHGRRSDPHRLGGRRCV